jgi:hypothetical protein
MESRERGPNPPPPPLPPPPLPPTLYLSHTLTHATEDTLSNKRTPPMKVMREKTQLLFSSFFVCCKNAQKATSFVIKLQHCL